MCVHDFDIIQSYTGIILYYVVITLYRHTVRSSTDRKYNVKL